MVRWLPIALLLLSLASASAQIKVESTYQVYTQIELDVEPAADATTYRDVIWDFTPAKISGKQMPDGRMLFTAPPGKYNVTASVVSGTKDADKITIAADGHKLWKATFAIVAGDTPPDPDDGDDVQPAPVVVEGAIVLIFEESAERTPATAKMLADAKYWSTIIDRGMKWRTYDIDSPDAKPFAEKIKPIGLPALVITAKDGAVLSAAKLPTTNAEVDAAIKKATGK